MDPLDTVVAELSCREVLHRLNDFLDGDLPDSEVTAVRSHLAGCRNCERFGGRMGAMLAALRTGLGATEHPPEPPAGALDRLRARLAGEVR